MGIFGDLFNLDIFDLDGNGTVDDFEELVSFNLLFGDNSGFESKASEQAGGGSLREYDEEYGSNFGEDYDSDYDYDDIDGDDIFGGLFDDENDDNDIFGDLFDDADDFDDGDDFDFDFDFD